MEGGSVGAGAESAGGGDGRARAEGRRLLGRGLLRGKGPRGVRRCSLCRWRGTGARGPWARSPEVEGQGGRGGGRSEGAAEAAAG